MIRAAIIIASLAGSAQAQAPCAPREAIVAQLERKYGEVRVGAGLQTRGTVTEIYASPKTGTWTIIVTRPDGMACAMSAGEAWQTFAPLIGERS